MVGCFGFVVKSDLCTLWGEQFLCFGFVPRNASKYYGGLFFLRYIDGISIAGAMVGCSPFVPKSDLCTLWGNNFCGPVSCQKSLLSTMGGLLHSVGGKMVTLRMSPFVSEIASIYLWGTKIIVSPFVANNTSRYRRDADATGKSHPQSQEHPKGGVTVNELGLAMKIARLKRGLTQLQLAHALGVREDVITYIETGRRTPTPELRRKIESLLGPLEKAS